MINYCYYYNETLEKFDKTNFYEMLKLEKINPVEFLIRRKKLYLYPNIQLPLVMVKNGKFKGFRHKGIKSDNSIMHRGKSESLTHKANKEVISNLKNFAIRVGKQKVEIYVDYSELEKPVICNSKKYITDVYFKLKSTKPEKFYKEWNGEIYFEIFHTCKVNDEQGIDFEIENRTLIEYSVPEKFNVYDNVSKTGYERRKKTLELMYKTNSMGCVVISKSRNNKLVWRRSTKGNLTSKVNGKNITVFKNENDSTFSISYVVDDNVRFKNEYNSKKIKTEAQGKKIAEHIASNLNF